MIIEIEGTMYNLSRAEQIRRDGDTIKIIWSSIPEKYTPIHANDANDTEFIDLLWQELREYLGVWILS